MDRNLSDLDTNSRSVASLVQDVSFRCGIRVGRSKVQALDFEWNARGIFGASHAATDAYTSCSIGVWNADSWSVPPPRMNMLVYLLGLT